MIYYLEDDEQIRVLTLYTLGQAGHETKGFACAAQLYEALGQCVPDLFLLDVMLPGEDGISVVKKLREDSRTCNVPVMMLTAKSTEFDTVIGLDAGADDYLAKPFGMMELLSRVNALLRRASRAGGNDAAVDASGSESRLREEILTAGPLVLDAASYRVSANGEQVHLTHKEFEMLRYFMRNRGIVISRDRLLEQVWGYVVAGETRTVDAHVQTLRKKLGEASAEAAALVETVRGVGYRLKDEDL